MPLSVRTTRARPNFGNSRKCFGGNEKRHWLHLGTPSLLIVTPRRESRLLVNGPEISLLFRSIHADQLVLQAHGFGQRLVNAVRQCSGVVVAGAGDDAGVLWRLRVQANEMSTIKGQQASPGVRCENQDVSVWDALICLSRFVSREHVMTVLTEQCDDGLRKIFVRVEQGHFLGFLFGGQYLLDLGGVFFEIRPSRFKVSKRQIGMLLKNAFVGEADSLPCH